jgi:hypothetical protein
MQCSISFKKPRIPKRKLKQEYLCWCSLKAAPRFWGWCHNVAQLRLFGTSTIPFLSKSMASSHQKQKCFCLQGITNIPLPKPYLKFNSLKNKESQISIQIKSF